MALSYIVGISAFLLTSSAALAETTAVQKDDLPNIVLIIGDDHGWPYYGFLGDENVVTPHLDQLATSGALFTMAHSTSNYCRPTLQTLVTGLYPSQYKGRVNAMAEEALEEDEIYQAATGRERFSRWRETEAGMITQFQTLPRALSELGYASFQGGKWWEQSYAAGGFTEGMSAGWTWQTMMEDSGFFEFMGGEGIELARTTMEPLEDFIETYADQPMFIWYGPALPHVPFAAPEEYTDIYADTDLSESAKDYYANIAWFDDGIGEMIDMLEDRGELENTMFVYVNDNGWEQPPYTEYKGNKDLYQNGGTRGKDSLFDTAYRTPVFFTLPGTITPARNQEEMVSAVDIVPTILDYAGADIPDGLPGYSLRPVIDGGNLDGRDYLIGYADVHRGDSTFLGEFTGPSGDVMGRAVEAYYLRSQKWHFMWVMSTGEMALFDMEEDPGAITNVADDHPALIVEYKKEIEAWRSKYVLAEME